MLKRLDVVFNTKAYTSPTEKDRARIVYLLSSVFLVAYTLYALLVPRWPVGDTDYTLFGALTSGQFNAVFLLLPGTYIFCGLALTACYRGYLGMGSWSFIGAWYLGGVWVAAISDPVFEATGIALLILVLVAGLLEKQQGLIITGTAAAITLLLSYVARGLIDSPVVLVNTYGPLLGGIALIYLFLNYIDNWLESAMSEAIAERIRSGEIMSAVNHLIAERRGAQHVFNTVVQSLVESFDYLHRVSLYLVDEDQGIEASLIADSDQPAFSPEAESVTRTSIGGITTVGQVTLQGQVRINTLQNSNQVEVVIPLKIGDRVIGALDLRGRDARVFENNMLIDALESLAGNIALAIDNVRQFERAEGRVHENERLMEQSRAALREVERLNQRLTGSAWSQYLRQTVEDPGLSINFGSDQMDSRVEWTPTLEEAVRINHLVQQERDDHQVIALPLRVRGQVIGAMEFELDQDQQFTPEDLELMQEVSERFGLAAENTRLVSESQRVAHREALVNQISARLQSANSVQMTLLEAARGLRDALKAEKVAIRLGDPPANSKDGETAS